MGDNGGAAAEPIVGSATDAAGEVTLPSGATHRRIAVDDWENIYVVGDVHGCIEELRALLDRLEPGADELVVFVGDLVRKGPHGADVVELVRSRRNFVSVAGNNEAKLLRREPEASIADAHRGYLDTLPTCLSWSGSMVLHGGVDPGRPISAHEPDAFRTMRAIPPENGYAGPFWFEAYRGPPRIFFGHTVLAEPFVGEHAVGLDTGCVYGGALTAYDTRNDDFVRVPARREYQPRSDEKIAEPG